MKVLSPFLFLLLLSLTAWSQEPFPCNGRAYLNYGNVNQNGTVYIGVYDTLNATVPSNLASTTQFNHNALGFNYADSLLYAISNPIKKLYRIDYSGTYTDLGAISGFSASSNIYAGDFDASGIYVVSGGTSIGNIFRIDVTTTPPSVISIASLSYSLGTGTPNFSDFAYNPLDSLFYGMDQGTGKIHNIDAVTGVCTPVSTQNAGPHTLGGVFFNASFTRLMGHGRFTSSGINDESYSCDIATGVCTMIANNGQNSFGNNDACGCNPFPEGCTEDSTFIAESLCSGDSFALNDTTIYNTYIETQTFQNQAGCDSFVSFDIQFSDSVIVWDTATICPQETLQWFGQSINDSGAYEHLFISDVGCDTTFHLQVYMEDVSTTIYYTQNGISHITTGGTFVGWIDCKTGMVISTQDTLLNVSNVTLVAGIAQAGNGLCTDTSDCIQISGVLEEGMHHPTLTVFPNPTRHGVVTISSDITIDHVTIYNANGQRISTEVMRTSPRTFTFQLPAAGIYLIKAKCANSEVLHARAIKLE